MDGQIQILQMNKKRTEIAGSASPNKIVALATGAANGGSGFMEFILVTIKAKIGLFSVVDLNLLEFQ